MRKFEYPSDENGFRACQVCAGSVIGTEFVQLGQFTVYDGLNGHVIHQWYPPYSEAELEKPQDTYTTLNEFTIPNKESDDEHMDMRVGPCIHLKCVEMYLWGHVREVKQYSKRGGQ